MPAASRSLAPAASAPSRHPVTALAVSAAPSAVPSLCAVPVSNTVPGAAAASAPAAALDAAPPSSLDFWIKGASDLQVAFDFLTPPSRRVASDLLVGSYEEIFGDLCDADYSQAEAFQSICLQDASRRAAGRCSSSDLALFLRGHAEFVLECSLPGPPPGSPAEGSGPCFPPLIREVGRKFAKATFLRHRQPVHPLSRDAAFLMVVSFGRANFRLDLRSVELALEAVLGARGGLLQVVRLAERVFRFSVCSKQSVWTFSRPDIVEILNRQ
ncbi:uncharacterized protein LOC112272480 isoform X1 [Brachypodium distachyon]|uniref:uncharacterized protein LOC112272480 isoform X1 n=1 Tax=Brachypodium distachyon TaxID=15368 RepID=UPI000D0D38A3|nr:uncharacterized protein LOC112272480 isoform X1 [Brachypodium distachyon]|eukprot:XP_024319149.1 uncharacterized protein LOC112272480 isoform X1 [Brachypodium distachyon]